MTREECEHLIAEAIRLGKAESRALILEAFRAGQESMRFRCLDIAKQDESDSQKTIEHFRRTYPTMAYDTAYDDWRIESSRKKGAAWIWREIKNLPVLNEGEIP